MSQRCGMLALLIASTTWACSAAPSDSVLSSFQEGLEQQSPERMEAFRRATVWNASNVEEADIRRGPSQPARLPFLATVTCDYVNKPLRGHSLKFACDRGGDVVRVKFGGSNGEVYAEVAATRLLWALGFGADQMYPVRVICRNCPSRFGGTPVGTGLLFDPAVVERPLAGAEFENDGGWSWPDLDSVDDRIGGAPRAHKDALKLLAAFLQHADNKTEQQRLLCLDEPTLKRPERCAHPFLILDDVGLTFGTANLTNDNSLGGANLAAWERTPVWAHGFDCVGNLSPSFTATMSYPRISEEGRQFLAGLLGRLSQRQIRDLFEVSRVSLRRGARGADAPATVEDWVRVFNEKRDAVVNRRCD